MKDTRIADALNEIITTEQVLKCIYTDAEGPATAALRLTLADVIDIDSTGIKYPIFLGNEKRKIRFAHNLMDYARRLSRTEKANHIAVKPEIAEPILEKFTNISNPALLNAFVKLLIAASNRPSEHLVHAGFIKTIDQISADEIKIINRLFSGNGSVRCVVDTSFYTWHMNDNKSFELWSFKNRRFVTNYSVDKLESPEKQDLHIEHLISLGVIRFDEAEENEIKQDSFFSGTVEKYNDKHEVYAWFEFIGYYNELHERRRFKQGMLSLTNYGSQFFKACLQDGPFYY